MSADEPEHNPMDAIEFMNAMRQMAAAVRVFYLELIEQEFSEADAMRLAIAWIVGTAGGKAP